MFAILKTQQSDSCRERVGGFRRLAKSVHLGVTEGREDV